MTGVFVNEDHSWSATETSFVDNPLTTSSSTCVNHDFQLLLK